MIVTMSSWTILRRDDEEADLRCGAARAVQTLKKRESAPEARGKELVHVW
jgi:hypothetical protein